MIVVINGCDRKHCWIAPSALHCPFLNQNDLDLMARFDDLTQTILIKKRTHSEHSDSVLDTPSVAGVMCLLQMEVREDCCSVCRRSGELLMCDVCSLVYHLQCLDPPLCSVPVGLWSCPKCQVRL